jgi:hypothetical protein
MQFEFIKKSEREIWEIILFISEFDDYKKIFWISPPTSIIFAVRRLNKRYFILIQFPTTFNKVKQLGKLSNQ